MEMMGGTIHEGRKFPTIIGWGFATLLHALNNTDILDKIGFLHRRILFAHICKAIIARHTGCIVDGNTFLGLILS